MLEFNDKSLVSISAGSGPQMGPKRVMSGAEIGTCLHEGVECSEQIGLILVAQGKHLISAHVALRHVRHV